jgi:hypothetical protein
MDHGTATRVNLEDLLDGSVELLREHRKEMAGWLALEVLQFDPVALEDAELVNRLIACQERFEERLRAKAAKAAARRQALASGQEEP